MGNFVEDIAISGELILGMENKGFTIVSAPEYKNVPDPDNEGKEKRRLRISIKLAENGQLMDYWPNKSSVKVITAKYGMDMDKWTDKLFVWEVLKQKVRGDFKQVAYVMVDSDATVK